MEDLNATITQIVDRLRELSVSRVIVFGSSHTARVHADSDIDIAVVLSEPEEFASYDARLEARSRIRAQLRDINRRVPIDILLFTEQEFEASLSEPGFVSEEIVGHGRTVYEKAS
jgi:predicted nucleotidyltransferase